MNTLLLLILRVLSTTRQEIRLTKRILMSAISDFAVKQKAFNERQAASVDAAVASLGGLTSDVAELNRKIEELQNSPGGVTPADQALIDDLQTQGEAVAAKAEALAAALKSLDDQTPPAVPTLPA